MFSRLLIANRGEIACRIIRTCQRLGIGTVAVYSEADAGARHVRAADRAVCIGPAQAAKSYLDAGAIVRAALACGAEAIHPGYGFLSEKLELVDACAAAGLVFVGPHREAIARMGSKLESKRIAREAGVACVPGYDGRDQSEAALAAAAHEVGFPLLVKASAGGGGKGMRLVRSAEEFAARLALARAEARAAFGDDTVLLERYVERPRHLEVQLLGDRHGHLVHLFERECSIQRNYQKVIEEAPADHLDEAVRTRLFEAALALGRAIGYDSAGTVEFILDADGGRTPWFLEMNTRLQVEHPVTELTAGVDLVELQLRSAYGEALPFTQAEVRRSGWAIEARVNAEVPEAGFHASFGTVSAYEEPCVAGLRVDSGVDAASEVTPHYDSMVAKLVAHGATRELACERLAAGIAGFRIEGLRTNQPLLAAIVAANAFRDTLTTRFLDETFPGGWRPEATLEDELCAAAAAAWYFARTDAADGDRPLDTLRGFRLTAGAGRAASHAVRVAAGEQESALRLVEQADGSLAVEGGTATLRAQRIADGIRIGNRACRVTSRAGRVSVWSAGEWRGYDVQSTVASAVRTARGDDSADAVLAHLPGLVAELLVRAGDVVTAGTPLVVLEAMKLFHTLAAPRDGLVAEIPVAIGETVNQGVVLVRLAGGGE
ncbi:MAG: ATP-grasp domain-containing protein [Gammaproteobacteria bacterium]|nr:ATP-grasp domain-containing protein [Gammaproteobacteria bacterium]